MKHKFHLGLALAIMATVFFGKDILSPKVENMTLIDIDNHQHALYGKALTLVNMWASDCVACDKEMPKLKALHQKYVEKGFRVLAVALSYDNIEAIQAYNKKRELNFPVIYDQDKSIVARFGTVNVTPTSFLIDTQGYIIMKVIGEPDWQQWEAEIKRRVFFIKFDCGLGDYYP